MLDNFSKQNVQLVQLEKQKTNATFQELHFFKLLPVPIWLPRSFFNSKSPSQKVPNKSGKKNGFCCFCLGWPLGSPAWTSFRIRPGIYCGPFLMVRSQQLPTRIVGGESKKIRLGWWLNLTHLKKYDRQIGSFPPNFRGESLKQYLSCHHLESVASWKHGSLECYLLPFCRRLFAGIPGHKVVKNARFLNHQHMGVSENSGTPKSSILIRFSITINHPFWGTPIFGNTHMLLLL